MHSLLPKSTSDFASKQYWDEFFTQRRSNFEWYGTFSDYADFFAKYIKKQDNVLHIGCGNSDLGVQLYDRIECMSVTNVDISETVVKQMRKRHCTNKRPNLKYECMDALKAIDQLPGDSFSCILDKGTLDALCSDDDNCDQVARRLFDNVNHLLKLFGRYVLITIAPPHQVDSIAEYFLLRSNQWCVNVHSLDSPDDSSSSSKHVIFGFVFTRLQPSAQLPSIKLFPTLTTTNHSLYNDYSNQEERSRSLSRQLTQWVADRQECAGIANELRQGKTSEFLFVCPSTGLTAFYGVVVVNDNRRTSSNIGRKKKSSAAPVSIDSIFLVPYGENFSSTYANAYDRQSLCSTSMPNQTVLFLFANPRLYYSCLEALKSSLSAAVNTLLPNDSTPPILSTANCYNPVIKSPELASIDCDQLDIHPDDDDSQDYVRRLYLPVVGPNDFGTSRRIIACRPSNSRSALATLSARDLALAVWIELIARCNSETTTTELFYASGLYSPVKFDWSTSNKKTVTINLPNSLTSSNDDLSTAYSQLMATDSQSATDNKLTFKWTDDYKNLPSTYKCTTVVYDPINLNCDQYESTFTLEAIKTLEAFCVKHLIPGGHLIVVRDDQPRNLSNNSHCPATININEWFKNYSTSFHHLAFYTVKDDLMQDPSTRFAVFVKKEDNSSWSLVVRENVQSLLDASKEVMKLKAFVSEIDKRLVTTCSQIVHQLESTVL